MTLTSPPAARSSDVAEDARAFLELSCLLDQIESRHPELSAPLRLILIRAHREHSISWLDHVRFRGVVDDLLAHGTTGTVPAVDEALIA